MPPQDCAEIEAQVDELVQAGLLEPFPPGEFPKYCTPTFLVDKKDSTTRRMVGQYSKLNKRCKPHAGWLPNMEMLVEQLARTKFKSKLDLRSGFWQVGLTPRAQELTAITTPNGRCFRWLCMPFGLQGAPGVFQEMIEILIGGVKNNPTLKKAFSNGHIGAFFDDCGLGAQTPEEHLGILECLFQECQRHSIRIKLSKCEFEKIEMLYLGYQIGYGWWAPSPKKVEALTRAKVSNLKELQSFLGGMNFFRRHVPKFSQTSWKLTNLLKKDKVWEFGREEEALVQQLKDKLAELTKLGTPSMEGEIVIVTDSSDHQSGACIFQWQKISTESLALNDKQAPLPEFSTQGVKPDGNFIHNYPENWHLIPLGHI